MAGRPAPLLVLVLLGGPGGTFAQLSSRAVADGGPREWAIVGGMVHLGDSTVLEEGTVVLGGGLIVSVAEGLAAPAGAARLDASGKHVYPGFVTALSDLGLAGDSGSRPGRAEASGGGGGPAPEPSRGPEDRPATFSWRLAADSLDLSDGRIAARRDAGFTSAVSVAEGGIVSGRAAFWNLAGSDPRDQVIGPDQALMVRLNTMGFRSFPGSMMGVIAYLRQLFLDAAHYDGAWRMYEADPAGLARPQYDRSLAPLVRAALGEQPVLLPANLDKEIRRMVGLADELGLRPILYGGHEAAPAAGFLAEAGVPILVDLNWPRADPEADPEAEVTLRELRLRDQAPAGPAALAAAGVRFAFYRGASSRPGGGAGGPPGRRRVGSGGDLAAVRQAVERGLDREAALTALTSGPAAIFGVADRVGTLTAGKIANLVIADGDLFEEGAGIEAVFVDGVVHYPKSAAATDDERGDQPARGATR